MFMSIKEIECLKGNIVNAIDSFISKHKESPVTIFVNKRNWHKLLYDIEVRQYNRFQGLSIVLDYVRPDNEIGISGHCIRLKDRKDITYIIKDSDE